MLSPVAQIIHDVIVEERAEVRLFPDLYSEKVAEAIFTALVTAWKGQSSSSEDEPKVWDPETETWVRILP